MTAEPSGLRERKKAMTKASIQEHALRLFRECGYHATSVEQIAEAAGVSHRTVFRYFPTKEHLVTFSGYDSLIAEAFRAQPAELGPVAAFRSAVEQAFGGLPSEELADRREHQRLVLTVPELWAAGLGNITRTRHLLTDLVAERTGRDPSDPEARATGRLLFGALMTAWLEWAERPDLDVVAAIGETLASVPD